MRARPRDEDADAALGPGGLTVGEDPDDALVALLQSAARTVSGEARLRAAGLSVAEARAALEPPPLPTVEISTGEGEGGTGLAYIGALLLYVALISFGYAIASSIVTEKSSRVVEVILSAIRPVGLLAGKLIGVGILGLIQIAAVAPSASSSRCRAGRSRSPTRRSRRSSSSSSTSSSATSSTAASSPRRPRWSRARKDTQSTTGPILIVLIAAYVATNAALGDPSGGLATVGTFLPPMAPLVVPGRAAQGALPPGELIVSLVLTRAAIALVVVLAARIYDRSVLHFGTPMKLREAIRIAARRG